MTILKCIAFNPEADQALERLLEIEKAQGKKTNRSEIVRELIVKALARVEDNKPNVLPAA